MSSTRSRASWSRRASRASTSQDPERDHRSCRSSSRASPNSASFSGQNWLSVDSSIRGLQLDAHRRLVVQPHRQARSSIGTTIDIDTSGMDLFDSNAAATNAGAASSTRKPRPAAGVSTTRRHRVGLATSTSPPLTDSAADVTKLEQLHRPAPIPAIKEMTDAASSLGAIKSRISLQQDFVKSLMDALGPRRRQRSSMPT